MAEGKNAKVAGGAAKGAASGAATGAAIGTAVPVIGNAVGAVAGAVIGGIAGAVKANKNNKADSALPPREDPEERAAMNYTKRQRRAFQTGTATNATRVALQQNMMAMANKSVSAGGGTAGLNRMQQMFQQSMLKLNEQGQEKAFDYNTAVTAQLKNITQRKLELGMVNYVEKKKQQAQDEKNANESANSAVARGFGLEKSPSKANVSRYGDGAAEAEAAGAGVG